jgi:hypothetical protein
VRLRTVAVMSEEFSQRDLKGARFEWVDLTGASFELVYLRRARFERVDLTGATVRSSLVDDVDIDGEVLSLRVNGIDVVPLVEAELDRLHPERLKLRPVDAAGFREAWPVIEGLWAETVARAEALDPVLLHERVGGEWSFIETLRHLAFATDAWVRRVILGDPSPWHPLDLPFDEMQDIDGIPRDRDVRPSLAEVLALRADRMSTVSSFIRTLTDAQLDASTDPVPGPGFPESKSYPVREALLVVLNEEWWHRRFAERDLATLAEPDAAARV